jgi:hypothetical protein
LPEDNGSGIPAGLALAGWILYAASWGTPGIGAGRIHWGAGIFLTTGKLAFSLLTRPSSLAAFAVGLGLLGGWLANFSLVRHLPGWARIASIMASWLPFAIALRAMAGITPTERLLSLLYFYPWAAGIALIHIAAMARSRSDPQ